MGGCKPLPMVVSGLVELACIPELSTAVPTHTPCGDQKYDRVKTMGSGLALHPRAYPRVSVARHVLARKISKYSIMGVDNFSGRGEGLTKS